MLDVLGVAVFSIALSLSTLLALKERTWISPMALMVIWISFFIGGDVAYSYWAGSYGPNENDREILERGDLGVAAFAWGLALFGFLVGYAMLWPERRPLAHEFGRAREPAKNLVGRARVGRFVTLFAFTLSAVVFGVLVYSAGFQGELAGTIRNVSSRFSDGGGLWLVGVRMGSIALVVGLLLVWTAKIRFPFWFFLFLLVVLMEFGIGSRSGLLYGFALPLLIGYYVVRKEISIARLALVAVVAALFVGVIYRSLVRDVGFKANLGLSMWEILSRNMTRLPEMVWGGFEASSFDATINITKAYFAGERLLGETVWGGLVSFVPRALWAGKPEGGGNALYTQTYYPEFYWDVGSEYSISFVGELLMNFGWIGILGGFVLLGFLFRWSYVRLVVGFTPSMIGVFGVFFYAVSVSRLYSLLRGDVFNFVNQLFVSLSSGVVVFLVISFGYWATVSRVCQRESVDRRSRGRRSFRNA